MARFPASQEKLLAMTANSASLTDAFCSLRCACGAEVRVFYDVSGSNVEVLAIVPKSEAESWLAQFGSPK